MEVDDVNDDDGGHDDDDVDDDKDVDRDWWNGGWRGRARCGKKPGRFETSNQSLAHE